MIDLPLPRNDSPLARGSGGPSRPTGMRPAEE
jgi:hypothetical protein